MITSLGRLIELRTARAHGNAVKIGLDSIEPHTGRFSGAGEGSGFSGEGVEFEPGDILFGKLRPYLAKIWLADRSGAAVGDFHVYRAGPLVDPAFLRWFLLSHVFLDPVKSSVFGAKMPRADWNFIKRLEVDIPAIGRQRAIADYLDRETTQIDTVIEEQQRLMTLLRERRRAEFDSVLTSGTTGRPMRLKHTVSAITQGWSPQAYPWPADGVEEWGVLKAGAANYGVFKPAENKQLPDEVAPRPDLVVRRGQIVVSRANTRDLVGSAALVEDDFPRLMLCDKLFAFDLDETLAYPPFVAMTLNTDYYRRLLEAEATGSSHSMQNISLSDITNLPLNLPPVTQQRELVQSIRARLDRIDRLIAEAERLVELSVERRAALIAAAVTGQIDVGAAA
ncbi:type I restriction enzyme S subunit [Nocardioides zeae]|uniref:Type I restriction enzyme S subunit n=1 Tax=Nocardioides zeae TaxID=1457234 RepID=A0ACC6IFG4_9ACTN|nr:hypothetical protein [Nocardioides zeae]MDR6176499.1 type I restriction enzyme S subunit [Nocardioides zeae]MDR6209511.1 type I restriction enzyme S subunit [Nocardioides zeae]